MSAIEPMIDACRRLPDVTVVRYRINGGEWQTTSGKDFLMLWDQPFAGTIDIDTIYILRADMGGNEGGK